MRAAAVLELLESNAREQTWGFSVPCSVLSPLIEGAAERWGNRFMTCSNEGEAVAAAFGVQAGGGRAVVFLQNSGLGNAVNPLTSLVRTFETSCTLVIGYRGAPGRDADEPQHRVMGEMTRSLIEQMGLAVTEIDDATPETALRTWLQETRRVPRAILVHRGPWESGPDAAALRNAGVSNRFPAPSDVVSAIARTCDSDTMIVASTGLVGRELAHHGPRSRNLSMVGSMGCAGSIGLGLTLSQAEDAAHVVVIDGDGALAMRLEAMIGIAHGLPLTARLDHVLVDNGVHETTGAQPTSVSGERLLGVAVALGYDSAHNSDVDRLTKTLRLARTVPGAHFHRVQVRPRSTLAPRPVRSPAIELEVFRGAVCGTPGEEIR